MPARPEVHVPLLSSGGSGPPPSIDDHFAPKYLVGNVPAGDPAAAQGAPFVYIPDPGDGSGIALALTQPNGPGDVWVRPGSFNLALSGTGPLLVPPGVRLQGSGDTTVILGNTTSDQGVFVLGFNSQLRDLLVSVPSSDAGSVTSAAVVRSVGALNIENVQITYATHAGGVLRYGLQFDPLGQTPIGGQITALRNVLVQATTTTGVGDPTAPINVTSTQNVQSFVTGESIVAFGGDVGVLCNGIFIVRVFFAINWSQYGVWIQQDTGTCRIDQSLISSANVPAANPIGIYLQGGGGHQLISVTAQVPVAGSRGIVADGPSGGLGGVQITYGFVFADLEGIRLGSNTFGVGSSLISDVNVQSGGTSILLGQSTDTITIRGCAINLGNAFASPVAAIAASGSGHVFHGNTINVQDQLGASIGIQCLAPRTSLVGNRVSVQGIEGIQIGGERCMLTANIVEMGNVPEGTNQIAIHVLAGSARCTVGDNDALGGNPFTRPCIVIDADRVSVGDNTLFVNGVGGPTPGIELNGADCTCLGNIVEGSGGTAVQDNGLRNEIAHNVGA